MTNTPYGLFVEGLEDDFHTYLHEIGDYPLLTVEQERDLIQRIKRGDREAREYFLHCNLKLVVSIARKYTGRGLPALDLIQEGNLGLIHALDLFDHSKGRKFSTYACWWIKQRIQRALHEKGLIHIPEWVIQKANELHKLEVRLAVQLQREPSDQELVDAMGISLEWLQTIRSSLQPAISLDQPLAKHGTHKSGVEEDMTIGMRLEDEGAFIQQENAEHNELKSVINEALKALTPRQREIIKLRYGLDDGDDRSLDRIGKQYRISRERVRQIEVKAFEKLMPLLQEVAQRWRAAV